MTDQVLAAGFGLSLLLGFVLHRSHFCTMGAISDWWLMGSSRRARQWALAVAVAVLGFGLLGSLGWVSPLNTIYNTPALPWLMLKAFCRMAGIQSRTTQAASAGSVK